MIHLSNLDFIKELVYEKNKASITRSFAETIAIIFNSTFSSSMLQTYPKYITYMMTHESLVNLQLLLFHILMSNHMGDIIEVGCFEGLTAVMFAKTLEIYNSKRKLFLYDSFQGLQNFSNNDKNIFLEKGTCKSSIVQVVNNFKKFNTKLPVVVVGNIEDTFPQKLPKKIAFAHLDLDLYTPTFISLKYIFPRLVKGGIIVMDDFGHPLIPGVKKAVEHYFKKNEIKIVQLYSGYHPILPNIWPKLNGKLILKKYQAYLIKN